jgi:hypothetical protein
MKKWIVILHNGKELKSMENVLPDAETLWIHVFTERIQTALTPFKADIEKEGGQVTVNLKGTTNNRVDHDIQFIGLSKGLQEKAHRAAIEGLSD